MYAILRNRNVAIIFMCGLAYSWKFDFMSLVTHDIQRLQQLLDRHVHVCPCVRSGIQVAEKTGVPPGQQTLCGGFPPAPLKVRLPCALPRTISFSAIQRIQTGNFKIRRASCRCWDLCRSGDCCEVLRDYPSTGLEGSEFFGLMLFARTVHVITDECGVLFVRFCFALLAASSRRQHSHIRVPHPQRGESGAWTSCASGCIPFNYARVNICDIKVSRRFYCFKPCIFKAFRCGV